jgi:hypothetical protein
MRPHERQGEQPEPEDDVHGALHEMFILRKQTFGYLTIQLGYVLGLGTQFGFKLLHGEPAPKP